MYCVQMLTVELLLSFTERQKQEDTEWMRFLNKQKQFLTDSSFSSMSMMISLLAYDKTITLNHNNLSGIFWSKSKKTVYLHEWSIMIECFQRIIRDAVIKMKQMLWQELMWVYK